MADGDEQGSSLSASVHAQQGAVADEHGLAGRGSSNSNGSSNSKPLEAISSIPMIRRDSSRTTTPTCAGFSSSRGGDGSGSPPVTEQQQQPSHNDHETDSQAPVTFDRELESLALSSAITELGYSIQAAFTLIFEVQVCPCQPSTACTHGIRQAIANTSGTLIRNCDMPLSSLRAASAHPARRRRRGRLTRTTRLPKWMAPSCASMASLRRQLPSSTSSESGYSRSLHQRQRPTSCEPSGQRACSNGRKHRMAQRRCAGSLWKTSECTKHAVSGLLSCFPR